MSKFEYGPDSSLIWTNVVLCECMCVCVCACGSEGQSESAVAPALWAVKPTLYPLPFSSLDLI